MECGGRETSFNWGEFRRLLRAGGLEGNWLSAGKVPPPLRHREHFVPRKGAKLHSMFSRLGRKVGI